MVFTDPSATGFQDNSNFGFKNRLQVNVDFSSATWNTVATHEVFTLTGVCCGWLFYHVTDELTSSGAATVAFGDATGTGSYSAAQTYANLVTDALVIPASTVGNYSTMTNFFFSPAASRHGSFVSASVDFGFQIASAALTGGTLKAYCFWTPVSSDGLIVAGAGGAL
jgi:hypothetical protein